jgi:hypothetical protein
MALLCIYGKCMTQTKSMNHTNIHTNPQEIPFNIVVECDHVINRFMHTTLNMRHPP